MTTVGASFDADVHSSFEIYQEKTMSAVNVVALILLIVGGLNWGLIGLFSFDLVAAIFGAGSALARIVYVAVGVSALWCLTLIGRVKAPVDSATTTTSARL
jgi:uncharacterized protein